MSGLSLRVGAGAGGGVAAAMPPSNAGSTIGQQAFGISSGSTGGDGKRPAFGATATGVVGMAFLVWLWWSLPR